MTEVTATEIPDQEILSPEEDPELLAQLATRDDVVEEAVDLPDEEDEEDGA